MQTRVLKMKIRNGDIIQWTLFDVLGRGAIIPFLKKIYRNEG